MPRAEFLEKGARSPGGPVAATACEILAARDGSGGGVRLGKRGQVYDRFADVYDRNMRPLERWGLARLRARALAEAAEALAGRDGGGRLLEVGAGTGGNFPFYPTGARAACVEPSREMLLRAAVKPARPAHSFLVQSFAERLPFADGAFDAVVSTFGVMFVADHARAAAEMVRVCRPGGRIGMANWTPEGFIGEVFKVIGRHVPPPPGARSPARWGTRAALAELFQAQAASIKAAERTFVFRYRSPAHWLDVFRRYYGPMLKAFGALPAAGQSALAQDLLALVDTFNRSGDESMVVPSEYLEVVVTRA
jgi:ubiquinone/menaquinone biosynthesis C-methylase UbiE